MTAPRPCKVNFSDDYQSRGPDPDYHSTVRECLEIGDVHYCSGGQLVLGERSDEETGARFVAVLMSRGGGGLMFSLTPDGAREVAGQLAKLAGIVEAQQQADAAAQLDAVLGRSRNG